MPLAVCSLTETLLHRCSQKPFRLTVWREKAELSDPFHNSKQGDVLTIACRRSKKELLAIRQIAVVGS